MLKTAIGSHSGRDQALNELANLITGDQQHLFAFGNEDQLLEALRERGVVQYCSTKPIFPLKNLISPARELSFSEAQTSSLQTAILVLEMEHLRSRQAVEAAEADAESEGEADADSNDEDEATNKLRVILDFIAERFTFKNEFTALYRRLIGRSRKAKKAHNLTQKSAEAATEAWERTKENLRVFFGLIGLGGVFEALDLLMRRSKAFELLVKSLGSLTLPILAIVYFFWVVAKWMTNPMEKFFRWFANEVDLRIPVEPDE